MDRDQWDERAEAVLKKLANRTWSTAWMKTDEKCISIVASAFRELAEAHKAEVGRWQEACASGWGEPTLINYLRAELARLKSSDPLETIVKLQEDLGKAEAENDEYSSIIVAANTTENNLRAEIARLKQALGDAQQEPRK